MITLSSSKVARFTYGPQDDGPRKVFPMTVSRIRGPKVISICLLYPYPVIGPICEAEEYREVSFCLAWQIVLKIKKPS